MITFFEHTMDTATNNTTDDHWFLIGGNSAPEIAKSIREAVRNDVTSGAMPADEEARIAAFSTSLSHGSFVASPERIELIRSLCQLYGRGVQAQKIQSHRKMIGPAIVAVKKVIHRLLLALLGASFSFQREFNAHVIRLLSDLCNEAHLSESARKPTDALK